MRVILEKARVVVSRNKRNGSSERVYVSISLSCLRTTLAVNNWWDAMQLLFETLQETVDVCAVACCKVLFVLPYLEF